MRKTSVFIKTFLTSVILTAPQTMLWAQEAVAPGATAPGAAKPPVNSFIMQLPMIVMFVALFYYIMIAPQRKQAKLQGDFQKSLSKGDEVVTSSGIIGTVAGLTEKVVTLEVSPGTEIKILRSRVDTKLRDLAAPEVKA